MKSIILIGMPSCGKTSIGKRLSSYFGYDFYDTDNIIEGLYNKKIIKIFNEYGEDKFRNIEAKVFYSLLDKRNCIISTGGGIVTGPFNFNIIDKDKFVVIYIKRNLNRLLIGHNRPLSKSFDDIKKLYKKRKDLYIKYSDFIIENRYFETTITNITNILLDYEKK